MPSNLSFIVTYDNSELCCIKYVSETATEILGWELDELIGQPVYGYFDPVQIPSLERIHISNVMNEKLCSMVSYRFRHKNGSYVMLQTVVHYCYDTVVTTNWVYDPESVGYRQRMNSVDEAFVVKPNGELELASMGSFPWRPRDLNDSMKYSLKVSQRWNSKSQVEHEQEPRFYLLLNRYSDLMNVVYVSDMISNVLGVQSEDCLGKSLYQLVHPHDRVVVEAQCMAAKSHYVTARIRFDWIVDETKNIYQPVDTIVCGATDGLVMAVRLAPKPINIS
ncbi:uncharacterized protein BX664DRAFT_338218 [Halteromyces radiatus]|uniref:uncharacterized protein n=1 Tax=Halteromyces radiatus TaxID=101107 RepID=UPI00221FB13D|nr:uncharacterized protein BX664DRAFT_338218 [Halteromyces radiatus]KAI8084969.1 hypothetical protein BX664DRAFT_338218 [Halteromyces radiatus]